MVLAVRGRAAMRTESFGNSGNGGSRSSTRSAEAKKSCTVIDPFSGAGGFTLGCFRTGRFHPIFANDFNHWAAETYNANFGRHCQEGDINTLLATPRAIPRADIVIGGPPCQG